MAISVAQFEFVANTTTGVQTIASGLGFTPKAYIIWTAMNTADATYQALHAMAIGFSDGTTSRSVGVLSVDAGASSAAGRTAATTVVRLPSVTTPTSAVDAIASHDSFGSGTIAINWTDAPSSAWKFYGIAFGGTDLSAAVRGFTWGTTSTGNHAYTGVGFQGEVLFTLTPEDSASLPFSNTHATIGFGAAVSATKRFLLSIDSEDAQATMDTWRFASSSLCAGALRDATGAATGRAFADFVSWDADGFTLNITDTPSSSAGHFFGLVMSGGDWDLGSVSKRTSTGDTTISPSVNTIKGLILASNNTTTNAASQAHARFSLGAASSPTTEGGCWSGDQDNSANAECANRNEDSNILVMAQANATHGSSTTDAIANISAMSTTATLTYTTASATTADIFWVACGEVTSTLFTRGITESTISVGDSNARVLYANRALSESSISVSDSNTRVLTANRPISESSISVSDALVAGKLQTRSISESAISVGDSLARIFYANRAINESAISVGDALTRFILLIRAINESSISVGDSLARTRIVPRSITESTITVSDALARTTFHFRTINEASISVSDAVLGRRFWIKTINEPAISVGDSLTRRLTSFRTLNEPTIVVSEELVAIVPVQILAQYITDPGYTNPLRFRVTWKSKLNDTTADESGDQIIYYRYDTYVPEDRPFNIIDFAMRLTQGEISSASLTIEDHADIITDTRKIGFKSVVEIDFKKELGRPWERILTGVVRRVKTLRPAYRAKLYQITVLSKQIIDSERIINFKRAAKRGAIDSNEALTTDANMRANKLFKEIYESINHFPRRNSPAVKVTGEFDLETGTISENVNDFITEIAPGLTTVAETTNQLTEGIGAIKGVDEFGNPYLRYPTEKHSGIIITDNPADDDSALITSVNMSSFEFEDSIDIAEGFANRIYVLNSKDTQSTASSSKAGGFTTLTNRWIAQSFIATDNNIGSAAFILSRTGNPTNTAGTIKGVLRASNSTNQYPTGATLATFEISFSSIGTAKDTIFVNDIQTKAGTIVIGQQYWWVLQGTGLDDDTNTINWHHDNDLATLGRPRSAKLPLTDIDPTTPGDQLFWVPSTTGPVYSFSTFSSINHILTQADAESIKENGLIEAVVSLPAFDDDATYQKVLVKIIRDSAKIKRIYSYTRVTIPTAKLFRPGELVTVVDSKAKLNAEKIINAEIAEVSYNFDVSAFGLGCKYVDLRLIGFIDTVTDDYLENREC